MSGWLLQALRGQLADPQLELQALPAGGNSRSQLIVSPRHGELVVKHYPADDRNRLQTEYAALSFLAAQGLPVPQPRCAAAAEHYAIYQRLPGRRVSPSEVSGELVDQLLGFLARLHRVRHQADEFAPASEACLAPAETVAIIERRRERFAAVAEPALQNFLTGQFDPLASSLCAAFQRQCGADYRQPLAQAELTLSPSDFGFHNTLLDDAGRLAVVDFEYFGWDDPAKLLADFLWHPALALNLELKQQFVVGCLQLYGGGCRDRWLRSHPLHGLKWVLLLLNEFIPADWQRRQFAGECRQREERLDQQLEKARLLLGRIERETKRNPYDN